jgi:phosphatidylserine decarboxylase
MWAVNGPAHFDALEIQRRFAVTPIVKKLRALILQHGWQTAFSCAIDDVKRHRVAALAHINSLSDYLQFIDDMVRWAPRESGDSRMVHDKLVEFYFFLDQPSLLALQSPVQPTEADQVHSARADLTPLSRWIVEYAVAWGEYLDTAESAVHVPSFQSNPAFRWHDYMPTPSGYKTFNQFFARHVKPGYRPVAAPHSHSVVVAPADAVFLGQWPICAESTIRVKGLRWTIAQLLDGSPYADRFANGVFTHSGLRTFDYHRWHAPVEGCVVEARVIKGQAYLDVNTVEKDGIVSLTAVEGTGYQFVQMRGLVVLDSPVGLVACLPVGMAQVSSVVITAEVGRTLRKGEEMGYFQFGGSDFVMLFEACAQVDLRCEMEAHSLQGSGLGQCRGLRNGGVSDR